MSVSVSILEAERFEQGNQLLILFSDGTVSSYTGAELLLLHPERLCAADLDDGSHRAQILASTA